MVDNKEIEDMTEAMKYATERSRKAAQCVYKVGFDILFIDKKTKAEKKGTITELLPRNLHVLVRTTDTDGNVTCTVTLVELKHVVRIIKQ